MKRESKRSLWIFIIVLLVILVGLGLFFALKFGGFTGNAVSGVSFKGYLDNVYNNKILGWACDANAPEEKLAIHLFFDRPASGKPDMIRLADINAEPAVANLCGGNNKHRFAFDIPAKLKDGQLHKIYAYGVKISSGKSFQLTKSPINYTYIPCSIEFLQDRKFEKGFIGQTWDGRFPNRTVFFSDGNLLYEGGQLSYNTTSSKPFWVLMELTPANYFIDNLPQPKSTNPQIIFRSANGQKQLISNKDGSLRFIYNSSTEENHGNKISIPLYAPNTNWAHYGLHPKMPSLNLKDFSTITDHIEWNISKVKNLYLNDPGSKGVIFNNAYLFRNTNPNGWSDNPTQPRGIFLTLEIWTKDLDSGGLNFNLEHLGDDQHGTPIYGISTTQLTPPIKNTWKSYDFELISLAKKAVDYYNTHNSKGWALNYSDLILTEISHHTEIWGGLELDWTIRNWSLVGVPKSLDKCSTYLNPNIRGSISDIRSISYGFGGNARIVNSLVGWTCNSLNSMPLNYTIYIDNVLIGGGTANIPTGQDVCVACGESSASCNHKFSFTFPQSYFNNSNHTFNVYAVYNKISVPLYNSPKIFYLKRATCTSFTYSDWSQCSSNGGNKTRQVNSSFPVPCEGGRPILSGSC